MSTENPTRFEDESSDPTTTEAVVLDDDLEVPVPAPVLGDDPAEGMSDDGEQPVVLDAPAGPVTTGPETVVVEPGPTAETGTDPGEEGGIPEAGVFPVGRPAQDVDVLATTSADGGDTADSPAVRRRSIFADAEPVTAEQDQTTVTTAPTTVSDLEEQAPAEPVDAATTAEPAATRGEGPDPAAQPDEEDEAIAPAWKERRPQRTAPRTEDDILLEGSTVVGKPAPRTAAHWAGVLLSLVLLPIAWFFLHDSAAQVMTATEPHRFVLSVAGLVELVIGALALVLALWTARRSSVGSFLVGALTLLIGLPGLVVPAVMGLHVTPVLDRLAQQSSLGADLASYVWADAATGRFAWAGLLLIMVGVVSHSARRAGRREQEVVDRVRKTLG
ncbi:MULTISPECIES: sulfite exporter TauE/SafE family protein [unclassified Actinomyces]|uniref:sulfite exporter TauE/SafE family protein n=1 Tax=unclassified Actinomyces TaxID=2609248 RepID=UPI0020176BE6|nr:MULTISPECIES: sulfite exporter TauE/SafE family protein [unclassified Actinomyces]MCL3778456.1 hypothetical protein [Actinomyces sp. AC-20-1]MCL3789319.1 hypothetical protein [Actinomyces sp. 187325]MCL3792057.1 hypothetical protein [Actinomyces sp. 186855]MCL3793986.1 hypothetical protein [Actinomyces sp. 217892]